MKAFRFPLDRALHWRAVQLSLEEAAASRLLTQRAQLTGDLQSIALNRNSASDAIARQQSVDSGDFQTLAAFHANMDQKRLRLESHAKMLEQEIQNQLRRTAEARRKKKLLEMLRERRLLQWTRQRDAEDENAAADSWLARFAAER